MLGTFPVTCREGKELFQAPEQLNKTSLPAWGSAPVCHPSAHLPLCWVCLSSPRPAPSTPASHMRACPALTLEIHAGPAMASTPLTPATAAAVVRSRPASVRSPPPFGPAPWKPAPQVRVGDFPSTLLFPALDTPLRWPIAGLVSQRRAEQRPGSCRQGSLVRVLPLPLHS